MIAVVRHLCAAGECDCCERGASASVRACDAVRLERRRPPSQHVCNKYNTAVYIRISKPTATYCDGEMVSHRLLPSEASTILCSSATRLSSARRNRATRAHPLSLWLADRAAHSSLLAELLRLDRILGAGDELKVESPLAQARQLASRRAAHEQAALIVDQHKGGEGRRTPHELEGDARAELDVSHILRAGIGEVAHRQA